MENFKESQSKDKDFFNKWGEKEKEIKENMKKLYFGEKAVENYKKINNFCENLISKYGRNKCLKYLAFHIIIESTPIKNEIEFFDFEGEDSIEKFLDELLREQKQEQENERKENLNTKSEDSNNS